MELKDFIKKTILDIAGAIQEANEEAGKIDLIVNYNDIVRDHQGDTFITKMKYDNDDTDKRQIQNIKFDVAVTAGGSLEGNAGASINVAGLEIGGEGKVIDKHSTVSRIQFEIPVALPNGKFK